MTEKPEIRAIQRRPYTRLTEAMSEVCLELNQARALVRSLELQYMWLEREHAQTQVYQAIIVYNPPEDVDLAPDQPLD